MSETKSVLTVWNDESPLKNVDELAVPDPSLAVGTVPDAKSDASKLVKFAPLIAGNVPVMFAAGTFVRFAALIAGNAPVKLLAARAPLNVVAVTIPVKNPSPSLLSVIPLPTTIPFLAVTKPTESMFVTSS